MKIKEQTRKFISKVWDKIEDHLATVVAGGIILTASVLCIIFWEWAKAEHSLEMYGWVWVLLCIIGVFLLVYFILGIVKKLEKIKDPSDIRNALGKWWRHCKEQCLQQKEFTLYFSEIDKKEKLKKGSAKKYLREVITQDKWWGVVREGPKTLTIKRKSEILIGGNKTSNG